MLKQLRGTGTALVTPFTSGFRIDFESLGKVINHNIEGGVDFLVSLGTTGESATLTWEEKVQVLEFTAEKINGRVPLVAGFGGYSTDAVVKAVKGFHFSGIEAILSVSPYYNKPTQEGIYQHYKALSDVAPVPVILYNVPGRTGSNIKAETTLRMAHELPNIAAVKEASGDLVQCMEIVRDKPDDFIVLSGDDALTLPLLSFGFDGVISVIANAFPQQFSDMTRFALEGDFKEASKLHLKLLNMMKLLFTDGNPGGAKYALQCLGLCQNYLRLPLVPVNDKVADLIARETELIRLKQPA